MPQTGMGSEIRYTATVSLKLFERISRSGLKRQLKEAAKILSNPTSRQRHRYQLAMDDAQYAPYRV